MIPILFAFFAAAPVPAEDWTPKTFKIAKPNDAGSGAVAVAVSRDGMLVAAGFNGGGSGGGGTRGGVRVWEIETGRQVMGVGTQGDLLKVAFGPGSKSVIWGRVHTDECGTFVRGFGGNLFTRSYDTRLGTAFAVTSDGNQIAVGIFDRVQLRDIAADEKTSELKGFPRGHGFTFTPDGKRLVGARFTAQQECYLMRGDVESGLVIAESGKLAGPIYTVAISPDGKQAATGHAGGAVRVWDENWKPVRAFETKTKGLAHPFFSPDGKFLAAGDQTSGEVVLWDRASGTEVRRIVFEDGAFRTTYTRAAEAKFRPESDPARFAFTLSGKTLLVGCNGVQLIALADGKVIRTFNVE